mmetsp:Transcript_55469/g.101543  ORF Transcript_55469/g.101543 Transcript_55469/m.101543 type:complete len:93 (+) Transcript_55469:268-546(+)
MAAAIVTRPCQLWYLEFQSTHGVTNVTFVIPFASRAAFADCISSSMRSTKHLESAELIPLGKVRGLYSRHGAGEHLLMLRSMTALAGAAVGA